MARIINRRGLLRSLGGLALLPLIPERGLMAATNPNPGLLTRPIPATGEPMPIIGMGPWLTFDVGSDSYDRARCVKILEEFFSRGGGMIDSSPMYVTAQDVIGYCLARIQKSPGLFSATKVWMLGTFTNKPHPTHLDVDRALEWIERVKPERAYLTHLGFGLDYETLQAQLPDNVFVAYDGLTFDV